MKNLHFVLEAMKNMSCNSLVRLQIVVAGGGQRTMQRDARRLCGIFNCDGEGDSIEVLRLWHR